MQDAMILHICSAAEWQASPDDHYRCASLDHEDFIHCSMPEQVVEVAGRLFRGRRDLVLLVIDPELVTAEIHCEDGGNGNFYPHIYGPLSGMCPTDWRCGRSPLDNHVPVNLECQL